MGKVFDEEDEITYSEYDDIYSGGNQTKKGMPKNTRWIVALLVELIVIVVLVAAIVILTLSEKWSRTDIVELNPDELSINSGANKDMESYTNIALFGIDARDSGMGAGNRSDAILVASINNKTKKIRIISLYRDTLLDIPGQNMTAKANAAYAYGGPQLGVQMLNENLDLDISEYITVNWEGLTRAIDALGGVTVHVEDDELEMLNACIAEQMASNGIMSNGVYETGYVTLNGVQATAYSRIRSTGQGDITRTERQREVLLSMASKLKEADAASISSIMDEVFPYIGTSITEEDMLNLLKNIMSYEVESTAGFPFSFDYYESDVKGSCLAPVNLTQNVAALHEYLFETKAYAPTAKVQSISSAITSETGFGDKGPVTPHPKMVESE